MPQPKIPQLSGRVYLLLAVTIFGAANAVNRKLTQLGAENLVDGRNPISFCNVLFVGNLCALILLIVIYYDRWKPEVLKQITWKNWLIMSIVAILGAAAVPSLMFVALSMTEVNNVILIARIETPIVLALSVWLLGERVNRWVIAGAVVSFIGVALTVLLQSPGDDMMAMNMGIEIGWGILLTVIATVLKAIGNLISKVSLKQIPLGIFSVFRMFVGTVVFFVTVLILFSPAHFMDVTAGFVWKWMLVYAAVIVVGGQLFWFNGLKQSNASEISLASAFNPIAGVIAAYLLLGEAPTTAQYIGGAIILGGIVLNQIGVQRLKQTATDRSPTDYEMNEAVSYKGI